MATVLHRETKQLLHSVHTPDYPANLWIHNPDMTSVADLPPEYWHIEGDNVREKTDAEKTTAHLTVHKTEKYSQIDERTRALIAAGFSFGGKIFSLSNEAQNRLMGTHQVRNEEQFVYPIKWNTLDDSDVLSIPDAETLHNFYIQALNSYRAHVDSGTVLKEQARAASSISEVDVIIDSR